MEIRTYIIEESKKLFFRYGFKSVTMDDIAKTLGMSKKTIYQHFKDKDELVNILIDEKIHNQHCIIKCLEIESKNAVDELMMVVTNMSDLLSNMNANVFYDLQKYYPITWKCFQDFRDQDLYGMIHNNLLRGIKENLYREDINPEILTKLRLHQIDMIFSGNKISDNYSLSEVMKEITLHFLRGICNENGLKEIQDYQPISLNITNI